MKILLFGGSGLLGKSLLQLDPSIIAPSHDKCDITNWSNVNDVFVKHTPDIVIHAAAVTDNRKIERIPNEAISVNIGGTCNVACFCNIFGSRLVYISTDYVYKGDRGNYKETDEVLPFNLYAWTKLGGEAAVRVVKNHLIIRTSFGPNQFSYKIAFSDKWSSKDYVDKIDGMILDAAVSPLTGVVNIGTERKTLYDYAKQRNPEVLPIRLRETFHKSPVDSSLDLQKWIDYKASDRVARTANVCRCCGSTHLDKYLDLGVMPLANNLEPTAELARNVDRYPLQVFICRVCSLSQLGVVVSPRRLFSYYVYRSGINKGYVQHCQYMADELIALYGLSNFTRHIDIAGNDGTLLKQFHNKLKHSIVNVDPAENLCAVAEESGVRSLPKFWSMQTVTAIRDWIFNYADLITATNVFAHVDDPLNFLACVREMLAEDGVLVLEFPYVMNFLRDYEFDTVYFEHLSYMGLSPLQHMCGKTGLRIISAELFEIHGGTIRVHIVPNESTRKTNEQVYEAIRAEEEAVRSYNFFSNWEAIVETRKQEIGAQLFRLKKEGYKIAAFAASAKGNTLLNTCSINTDIIDYIVDETPEKIGKFSPGTGIPIVSKDRLVADPPDYLIILSWNFAVEIIAKCKKVYSGKFIIPIPEFKIIEE